VDIALYNKKKMARPTRFEHVTFAFGGQGSSKVMRPLRNLSRSRSADSGGLAAARFLMLTPPIPRWLFTALGEPKTIALFSVSMDQIIGLTVGSNGRWCPKDSQHDSCLDHQRAGRRS
jgi:hypothetical protein